MVRDSGGARPTGEEQDSRPHLAQRMHRDGGNKRKNTVSLFADKNGRNGGHSRKLSDAEVDIKLKAYFATHTVMTRSDFQNACGFMKSTAMAQLRRLRTEGKIQNINIPTQPIYVPVPGHYGVNSEQLAEK